MRKLLGKPRFVACAITAAVALVPLIAAGASGAATGRAAPAFGPPGGLAERAGEHAINDVYVFSPNLAWFVGDHGSGAYHGIVRQWDGTAWPRMLGIRRMRASVRAADGLSPDDAWLVGAHNPKGGPTLPLAAHWDGSHWRVTRTPDLPYSGFDGVSELAPDDVWGVGVQTTTGGASSTLAEHWNGTKWRVVPTPNPAGTDLNILLGVVALAPDDVWALGETFTSVSAAYAEHWDGKKWSLVDLPDPSDQLYSISGDAPDDVWLAGGNDSGPVTVHWDGSQWTEIPAPQPAGRYGTFYSVTAIGPGDAWAVGGAYDVAPIETLTEHWDGTQWSIVPSPNPGAYQNVLAAVGGDSPDDVWAVGAESNGSDSYHEKLLYLHWDGATWTRYRSTP